MNERIHSPHGRRGQHDQHHVSMEPQRKRYEELFSYPVLFDGLAGPNSTDTQTLLFEDDCDFSWSKTTFYAILNGAAAPFTDDMIPEVTINMQLTNGRYLTNAPVPISSIAGTGREPFILPQRRLFLRRSALKLIAQNISAAATYNNVTFTLIGTQVFDFAAKDED